MEQVGRLRLLLHLLRLLRLLRLLLHLLRLLCLQLRLLHLLRPLCHLPALRLLRLLARPLL